MNRELAQMQREPPTVARAVSQPRKAGPCVVTAVAWVVQSDIDYRAWFEQGRRFGVTGRSGQWWLGDWVNYGNAQYGERYVRAARITGYDVQSLMNMAYVGARFESSRRRENLSWSHHAAVASLDAADQDAWLDRAAADRLSVRCLRTELRAWKRQPGDPAAGITASSEAAAEVAHAAPLTICPSCGHQFEHRAGRAPSPSTA